MKKRLLFVFVILAIILTACASKKSYNTPTYYEGGMPLPTAAADLGNRDSNQGAEAPSAPAAQPPAPSSNGYDTGKGAGGSSTSTERMIAQTIELGIIVPDPQKKMNEINQMALSMGGYLVSMNMSQVYTANGEKVPQGTIAIRVPSVKLGTAVNQIEADVVDVTSDNRYGQDVTSQYVDMQSQLSNLQQAEKDLLAIMDEAKNNPGNDSTTKTQDVLNVYNQIVVIRGQIESIQGQMKYLEETTSTAAITVNLVAEETVQPIKVGKWQPQGTANDAIRSLIKFFQGFVDTLIIIVLKVIPEMILVLGPIALIIWAIIASIKRGRSRKNKVEKDSSSAIAKN